MTSEILVLAALAVIAIVFPLVLIGILRRHNRALEEAVASCPECGAKTIVTPDPPNSRLTVRCEGADCGRTSWRDVRSSALSLFGVTELFLALGAGFLGLSGAGMLDGGLVGRAIGALLGFVAGGAFARLLVGLVVFGLLERRGSKLSPVWQEEIVSYLAPPSWRQSTTSDGQG